MPTRPVVVRGCLPPFPALPGSGCPQLHRPAATGRQRCPFITARLHGASWRTPEIRYTREGQASATFGLAVNRRWQSRGSDEWEEATSFFDVVCWRDLAENVALSLVKGSRVIVTGRLDQRAWENDAGERRSRVEVSAEDVGPSLRFATAEVTKAERRIPDEVSPGGSSDPSEESEIVGSSA